MRTNIVNKLHDTKFRTFPRQWTRQSPLLHADPEVHRDLCHARGNDSDRMTSCVRRDDLRLRRVAFGLLLILACASPARSQLLVGGSFLHESGADMSPAVAIHLRFKVTPIVSLEGGTDVGLLRLANSKSLNLAAVGGVVFHPRPKRFRPFAHALAGAYMTTYSKGVDALLVAGGGLDVRASKRCAISFGLDYRMFPRRSSNGLPALHQIVLIVGLLIGRAT
jgi:hypothetical protein